MQCIVVRAPSTTWQRIWSPELGWASSRFFSFWSGLGYLFNLLFHRHHPPTHHLHPKIVLVIIIQGAQVMHLVLGVIFPLAPLFLLRGQAREKSGIEVRFSSLFNSKSNGSRKYQWPCCGVRPGQWQLYQIVDREELLETSALSSAAPAVRISNNTRRSDLEPARYRHLHPHCHYFRYQGISYSSFACLQSVCSPKTSSSQVNPQKSLVCGESTVE